jgi:basic membrane protein A
MLILLQVVVPNHQVVSAEDLNQPREVIKVGLIPDEGGINDHGFNEMANEGLELAETEFGILGTVYPTSSIDDYGNQITQCAVDGNALCITVGFMMADATMSAALTYPGVEFAIMDATYESYPENLRGVTFAVEEAAYLAGVLASLMTSSNVIGSIGGMSIPPVDAFIVPYQYGAQWTNPEIMVLLDYAGTFVDPNLGAQIAQQQMTQGADVIFGVGGPTGNGAILEAAQAGAWVIGVDVDIWYTVFDEGAVAGYEKLLTSVLKRIDQGVFNTIFDLFFIPTPLRDSNSGTVVYGFAEGGVGFAPYHAAETSIPNEIEDQIEAIAQGIIAGEIDVWAPYYTQFIYLPLTMH